MSDFIKDGLQMLLKREPKESTRRVTLVGPWASGKTTVLGCLGLTCEILSSKRSDFKFWPDEKGSGIRSFWSELRRGRFPPATPPGTYYESSINISVDGGFKRSKNVTLPVCECAGEDIQKMIGTFVDPYKAAPIRDTSTQQIIEYILRSDAYILVTSLPRALLFKGEGKEQGPKDLPTNPDLNLARMLDAIHKYKELVMHDTVKGMAVLLTKYDAIISDTLARGYDLYDPASRDKFLWIYYPQTMSDLKKFGYQAEFFPVHVEVERDAQGKTIQWKDGTGDKIRVDHYRRLPEFAEQQYVNAIDWSLRTIPT